MALHSRKNHEQVSPAIKHSSAGPVQSILRFDQPESNDISRVGGKNAGLAEVARALASVGIRVPAGFAAAHAPA
jgi:hypothetical protein